MKQGNAHSSRLKRKKRVARKFYKRYHEKKDKGQPISPKEAMIADWAFGRILDRVYREYLQSLEDEGGETE
jgi:hypothetical protein